MEVEFIIDQWDDTDYSLNTIIKYGYVKITPSCEIDWGRVISTIESGGAYSVSGGSRGSFATNPHTVKFISPYHGEGNEIEISIPTSECIEVFRTIRDTHAAFDANPAALAAANPTWVQ